MIKSLPKFEIDPLLSSHFGSCIADEVVTGIKGLIPTNKTYALRNKSKSMKIIASSKGVSRWIFSYYYFTFDNVVLDKKNAERFQKKKFEKRKIRDLKFEKKTFITSTT